MFTKTFIKLLYLLLLFIIFISYLLFKKLYVYTVYKVLNFNLFMCLLCSRLDSDGFRRRRGRGSLYSFPSFSAQRQDSTLD